MRPTCYFCGTELEVMVHSFRVGTRDEPVCDECHLKTVNRQNAKAEEDKNRESG